ncbi:zinc-dependent alcohol dehydrogenase [Paenibacillus abyssi]|uniref:Galactitol-1-phosphate 5-dehydrogenase n=1 Tax=Paenibacillus abyssi TaxID=1340531 RepID=A0A917G0R7_9BACL|nr:alcohol dehydrogenase catalytic domain-containing protein [Paenibacillus abyssi]GGG16724.1 galactitol-1-phosphate 5-dehydrogenase [Paenibacillus abyssi]
MPTTMRAQVFYEPHNMRLENVELPRIEENEVLIKVKAVGICGSDISYYLGKSPVDTPTGKGPIILGHEISGEVVDMGFIPESLKLFGIGDKVIVNPAQPCHACMYCLKGQVNLCESLINVGVSGNGGFAEYVKARFTNVYKVPYEMSFEEAAAVEPLACATYGVNNLDVQAGDTVVVMGPGPIGLMMVQLVKARGAGKVILVGILDYSLKKGKSLGADIVLNTANPGSPYYTEDLVGTVKELTGGVLAQRVIVPTGSTIAMQQALEISGKKSTIVYFGLPGEKDQIVIPALPTLQADKTIRFSWLAPLTWPTAIQAVHSGLVDVKALITHRFELSELSEAIQFMGSKEEEKIKGMVIL